MTNDELITELRKYRLDKDNVPRMDTEWGATVKIALLAADRIESLAYEVNCLNDEIISINEYDSYRDL